MADGDLDGSSIRIKVAQHLVNKRLDELKSMNTPLNIEKIDGRYIQALPPQYGDYESGLVQRDGGSEVGAGPIDGCFPLGPLPPSGPIDIHWNDLLGREEERLTHLTRPVVANLRCPSWYRVAIIGAGVAGLRTAKLLQDKGIPYKIFEASDRVGGRLFTYEFPSRTEGNSQGDSQENHDYYDVGAMRFPKNNASEITFKLFDELGLTSRGKVIEYVMSTDENICFYNNIKSTVKIASGPGNHFEDEVPEEYMNKTYIDPWGREHFGVHACTAQALDPFRKALLDDFEDGWQRLMEHDGTSTRSYLTQNLKYPSSVVHWMETRNSGTGSYDRAFSEVIVDSLEFDDPTVKKGVEWKCLKGGTKVLVDAMLDQLIDKPCCGHHVTSIEQVCLPPLQCFRDLDHGDLSGDLCSRSFPLLKVSTRTTQGMQSEYFAHVVSTVSFAKLGTINTDQVLMTYKQRQAIRTLNYGTAVKVAIKFKTRWWEKNGLNQRGGVSFTDRPSRVVVYPSYGIGEDGPGVLIVTYNWNQDASRFGALINNPDWSEQLNPDREHPWSEQVLLDQIYGDLAALHGPAMTVNLLREETLDYHAFNWYQNPYTMGAYANFSPGQYSYLFADIVQPAAYGRFHFAGEAASHYHAWVAGALDSAVRVTEEVRRLDFPRWLPEDECGESAIFDNKKRAVELFVRGLYSDGLEEVGSTSKRVYN